MLTALFAEEDAISGRMEESRSAAAGGKSSSSRAPLPPSPRRGSGICGIANQGATCYLNSLLQTLFFTTEFREKLFRLGEDQLGSLSGGDARTRIIPLQLQRLFAKLLLLDVESASTVELTDSFGWTNNEELQQHDVQELNRILFQAIESSLVGTTGHSLVKDLYNGRIVNQISCLECGRVSEREEDFLDMNVTVSGNDSLAQAFQSMFVDVETMSGNNRYECASCRRLTDATKGMKIRSLPSIFTVSLLRFSYDLINFQRFKETGNFSFPTELDLTPYRDSPSPSNEREEQSSSKYELFSVIVHKGSCYGGHYHCYIRDKDDIGKWTPPENEKISLPTVATGKVDYLAFDDPTDIISALLVQTPSNSMTLDNLCAEISRVTGVSWNKRFKRQFGSITKFLRCNQNVFHFNDHTKAVTLLHIDQQRFANSHLLGWDNPLEVTVGSVEVPNDSERRTQVGDVGTSPRHSPSSPSRIEPAQIADHHSLNDAAPSSARWFNLDDAKVKSVREEELKSQFSGKESAYMLFYRRKATYPSEAVLYDLPPWLLDEVTEENHRLARQRTDYEDEINRLSVELLFSTDFVFENGAIVSSASDSVSVALSSPDGSGGDAASSCADASTTSPVNTLDDQSVCAKKAIVSTALILDRRKSIQEMIAAIRDVGGFKVGEQVAVNLARQFPAGIQLLNTLFPTDNCSPSASVSSLSGLVDGALLFVWNGSDVQGVAIPDDAFVEPVALEIQTQRLDNHGSPYQESFRHSFPKSMLLSELRHQLPSILNESAFCNGGDSESTPSPKMKCLPPSASIARLRASGGDARTEGGADNRHIPFDTLLLDSQHDDKTFLELGLIDFDTILVDLTGFSNDDFTPSKNTWAAVASEGKNLIQECLDVATSCSVTTDLNLSNGAATPAPSTPVPASDSNVETSSVPSVTAATGANIRVQAHIKAAGYSSSGDVPPTIEVSVLSTISVGKLKYVIIDAAKADVSTDVAPAALDVIPTNDSTLLNVFTNDAVTTATTASVMPHRLNGKFLRLRILEENFGLRTPLMEKVSLSDAGLKDGAVLVLEDGPAPKPGQITISFATASPVQEAEIIVEKDCMVSECIGRMVAQLSLGDASEGWHLRKTNWEGEAVEAVEDGSVSLDQEGIKDGDHVLLEEGVVPPKGFLRLPVWLLTDANGMEETQEKAEVDSAKDENVKKTSSSLNLLQRKFFISHLELTQDTTLLSLKEDCIRLIAGKVRENPSSVWPRVDGKKPQQIRIATIDTKGIQGSVLKGHKATLKVLHVTNNVQLLVSALDEPEDPSPSQVILRTYLRLPESRSYESLGEVLWETAGAGATAASLRTAIAQAHNYPSTDVVLAKYFPEKYEWMVLTDSKIASKQSSIKKQYGKQQSKKGSMKKNLRQSPYYIQDGDVIGVKTLSSDPLHVDNFMTESDDRGKSKQKVAEEDKRRKRQENRQRQNSDSQNVIGGGGTGGGGSAGKQAERKSRPEVALSIHVPKYE